MSLILKIVNKIINYYNIIKLFISSNIINVNHIDADHFQFADKKTGLKYFFKKFPNLPTMKIHSTFYTRTT